MVLSLPGYKRLFIIDTDTGDIKWAEAGFQAQVADSSVPALPHPSSPAASLRLLFSSLVYFYPPPWRLSSSGESKRKERVSSIETSYKKGPSASSTRTSGTLPRSCSCFFLSSDVNIAGESPLELPHQAIAHNLSVQKCLFPTPSLHF